MTAVDLDVYTRFFYSKNQLLMKPQRFRSVILFSMTFIAFVMLSPKWTVGFAAWVAPGLLIYAIRELKPWKAYVIAVAVLFLSSLVSLYKVMPFPGVLFVVISFLVSLQTALPYWINRVLYHRFNGWASTLIFPSALTALEYITSFGGSGTWGSIAYTQMSNLYLMQTTSLVGIWGITFLIGWFASIGVWALDHGWNTETVSRTIYIFSALCFALLLFGKVKVNKYFGRGSETIRVAGITGSNLSLLQGMYEDTYGKRLDVDEENMSQNSAELSELQKGLAAFLERAEDDRYRPTKRKLKAHQDSLFALSAKEANAGSKIITWSEALAIVLKADEGTLIEKGSMFASHHKVYLLITLASMHPGRVEFGKKFIENKAVFFGPDGKILNIFFKNKPVPVVEPSVAGDGNIPVIPTPYGNVAISICYDADFPMLMQQLSTQRADILLLPSGDWREVSPYHAQMASVRAIENAVSLLRPVSFAQSIATDRNGRIIATRNYYDKGEKVLVAHIPVNRISTMYSFVGDSFAWLNLGGLFIFTIAAIGQKLKIHFIIKQPVR